MGNGCTSYKSQLENYDPVAALNDNVVPTNNTAPIPSLPYSKGDFFFLKSHNQYFVFEIQLATENLLIATTDYADVAMQIVDILSSDNREFRNVKFNSDYRDRLLALRNLCIVMNNDRQRYTDKLHSRVMALTEDIQQAQEGV